MSRALVRARPLPLWGQLGLLVLGCAVLVLATPVGVFLQDLPLGQARALWTLMSDGSSWEMRRARTLGPDYRFLAMVRDNTPEDAVILMSDQVAPSVLQPQRAKNQSWATFYLYPRRVLYLHQDENAWYAEGEWLIVDGEPAVSWIAPEHRIPYQGGPPGCERFDMGGYLDEVAAGRISRDHLPPSRPLRSRARPGRTP